MPSHSQNYYSLTGSAAYPTIMALNATMENNAQTLQQVSQDAVMPISGAETDTGQNTQHLSQPAQSPGTFAATTQATSALDATGNNVTAAHFRITPSEEFLELWVRDVEKQLNAACDVLALALAKHERLRRLPAATRAELREDIEAADAVLDKLKETIGSLEQTMKQY